jgi:quinol monooxygenase YgiN
MLHVITLLSISPDAECDFVRSLHHWQSLARRIAPGLISTDVLRHRFSQLFHCQDFWVDEAAYLRARQSPAVRELMLQRERMATACLALGPFSFARIAESEKQLSATHVSG